MSNSEDCFKYQFHGSNSSDLNNIFTNNSNTINPLLPFGVHIKGGVSICTTKCGHTLNNCENIKIENIINYGKILVMVPNKKDSELILHYDSRNENADQDGNGKYRLKYICFTCPSTIKIGDIDSDLQSYLIYTNNNGLYCIISTLYRNASPVEPLADSLLNTLLTNNLPNIGSGGSSSATINLSDFFPQTKQDLYEFVNTENNSNKIKSNIIVKVYAKKVNIGTTAINNIKQKLFNSSSNCTFNNFKDLLDSNYSNKPSNINIFYVPDIGVSKVCSTKERMQNIEKSIRDDETEEEDYDVEEEMSIIEKLTKANLEDKKEKYINFTDDLLVYKCDLKNGHPKKVFKNSEYVVGQDSDKLVDYIKYKELLLQNPDYDEDELKRSINEFPNYIYKDAYWRVDYTVRLYKKTDTENDFNFEIIDVNSIEDAVKKIGDSTPEDVFYSMKNFPNVPVGDYYVSYYYNKSTTANLYVKIMYILFCVLILLFNFLFYKLIFYFTNKEYGDISIDDDEIINNENFKQLASWRLLINIIFVIQMIATIIYSIFKVANVINDDKAFNGVFLSCSLLTLIFTLVYAYFRLQFGDKKVSYAEHKSLKVILESSEEEDNGFITYIEKASNLLKNSLFYSDALSEDNSLSGLYDELSQFKDQLEESNEINESTIEKLSKKAEEALSKLNEYLPRNINNSRNRRSRFQRNWQSLKNKFSSVIDKLNSDKSSKQKKVKKNAISVLSKIKQQFGETVNNITENNNQSNNNQNNNNQNNNTQKGGGNNKSSEISNQSSNEFQIPIVTGVPSRRDNKNSSYFSNNENNFMTSRNIAGTETFPAGSINNNDDFDDEIEKGNFFKNLIESITLKNIFIYHVFLITFTTIGNKIKNIIGTFDTTDKREYITMTGIINLFSTCVYYGILCVSILLRGYDFIKWYFYGKNNNQHKDNLDNSRIMYMILYVFYVIFVCTMFNYSDDKVKDGYIATTWVFISLFLVYQIYIILKPVLDRGDISILSDFGSTWKIYLLIIISILFFILPPALTKTGTVYKVWLVLIPIIIAFTINYLGNLINILLPPKNIEINNPITLPNVDPINHSQNNSNINTPVTMPNLEELGSVLSDLQQTGGASENQKKKLSSYIKNLNELSDYFKKNGKIGNQQIVDRIKDDIQALI